jgi:DNA-directed RNA polymerase specialized sigma24 family protein
LDNEYTFAEIQKAMIELDEMNKEIISLKFIEDKSYEEISEIL